MNDEQLLRYSRHILLDDIGIEGQQRLLQSRALVIGAGGRLTYTPEPRDSSYKPSVDAFFQSAARRRGLRGCGVLLTGMGRDGADGLLAMRKAGFHTIAQDRQTSVVWGMPKAAAENGAAIDVLPLQAIGPRALAVIKELSP